MDGHFVSTYMRKKKGRDAEKIVWNAIKETFKERECLGYWNYPIFTAGYSGRKEPDILLLDCSLLKLPFFHPFLIFISYRQIKESRLISYFIL